jgi:hypothetical protein
MTTCRKWKWDSITFMYLFSFPLHLVPNVEEVIIGF